MIIQIRRQDIVIGGKYFWAYGDGTKSDEKGLICTSYKNWKTKNACLANAIKFSKSLKVPVNVNDITMSRIMPWGLQATKFRPKPRMRER
jgi:hypothetical protein